MFISFSISTDKYHCLLTFKSTLSLGTNTTSKIQDIFLRKTKEMQEVLGFDPSPIRVEDKD